MTIFVAICRARGWAPDDAHDIHRAVEATTERMTANGERIAYLRSTYLPEAHWWFGVFAAEDPAVVRRIARITQLSGVDVYPAMEFATECTGTASAPSAERNRSQ